MAPYAVVTSDKHGTILSANQEAVKLFGFSISELVGNKVNMLMPLPYSEQHDTYLKRYQMTKESRILGNSRQVTGVNKDGQLLYLILTVSEAETVRGALYIGMFEVSQTKAVMIDTDLKGEILNARGNVFLTFGYHKDELIGKNISCLCPEPIASHHDHYMANHLVTGEKRVVGKVRNLQAVHKTKKEPINISLCVNKGRVTRKNADGETEVIEGYKGTITPVDDVEAMVTVSKHGRILSASDEFYLLFGYTEEEVTGENISLLVKGDLRDIFTKKTITSSKPKSVIGIHKDTSVFTAEITIQPSIPSDEATENRIEPDSWICKIGRTSPKKVDKDELVAEGDYLGMYEYGKILGAGYFGKVRVARHRMTGERVAIKTLRKKQYLSINMEYPPREIAVLKAIRHPVINRLFDTVVLSDRIHLVLEFVEGRELCEIVESKQIPEDISRHIWRQVLSGIAYLHDNNIVHRDLKLENIIIDKSGNAKIIDMGFGQFILDDSHMLRTFCGSPDYAAPELFLGKAYNGYKADCWSLGVLLYTMLCNALPFANSNDIMKGKFLFPEQVGSKARHLISSILCIDIANRFTIQQMIEHPWTNIGYSELCTQTIRAPTIQDEIDAELLQQVSQYGMNPATVRNSLMTREFNQFTTTYYLLQSIKNREKGEVLDVPTKQQKKEKPAKKDGKDKSDCRLL